MRKPLWVAAVSLVALLGIAPTNAAAEPFLDLFAGAAFTDSNDLKLSAPGISATGDVDYNTSFSVGGRAGYWFGFFGLNLDVNYFRPNIDTETSGFDADIDVVGVGLNAMLRGRFLKTTAVPDGALQPYIFAGPTLFISRLDIDISGAGSDHDTDTHVGFTAGTGVTYMFTKNIGAFGEYRFTYNRPEFDISGVKLEPKLNTHHIVGGVTFRF
jgi:opacity protein-like surface antigen